MLLKSIAEGPNGEEIVTLTIGPAERGQQLPTKAAAVYLTQEPPEGAEVEPYLSAGPNAMVDVPAGARSGADLSMPVVGVPPGTYAVYTALYFET